MVVAAQRKLKWWTQWPQVHGDPVSSCPVMTCQSVGRWLRQVLWSPAVPKDPRRPAPCAASVQIQNNRVA